MHFEFAHPENTVIGGSAEFYVPSYAGLRLYAFAGVGASALVVDLTGRLELGATLSVMGEGRARVDMRWTPTEGLSVNALAEGPAEQDFGERTLIPRVPQMRRAAPGGSTTQL